MNRGDIYWYEDQDTKSRPFLVLTRSTAIPVLRRLLAAPITSTIRGIASEVRLTVSDGLPRECVISFDNVRLIERERLRDHITTLSVARLAEVCEAFNFAVDC